MYRLVFATLVGFSLIGFNSAEAATLGSLLGLDEALMALDSLDNVAVGNITTNSSSSPAAASNGGGSGMTMTSGSCCSPQVSCCGGGNNGGGSQGGNTGSGGLTIINIDIDITVNNFYGSFCKDVASACGCN